MAIRRFEIVPQKLWRNSVTGASASIYGACPWYTDEEAAEWSIVETGYLSLRDNKDGITWEYTDAVEDHLTRIYGKDWLELTI